MNKLLLSLLATFLVGLISGWVLFELTEWRRRRLAQRELRRALQAELESAEVFVSTIVCKYARLCQTEADKSFVANEIRWFRSVGRNRMQEAGILSDLPLDPNALENLSDSQIIELFSSIRETIGTTIILPVVESALAGHTTGFNAQQIQALGMVRWQAHLLEQDAESMKEFLRLSFEVTDETNHKTVVANHDQRTLAYSLRARTLLRAVRAALLQQIQ